VSVGRPVFNGDQQLEITRALRQYAVDVARQAALAVLNRQYVREISLHPFVNRPCSAAPPR